MHNYSISKINLVCGVISIIAVTSYMESRALNESLFAHMHFYKVINFGQSIHCLAWQMRANNEWSSNAPQTRTASISLHGQWGRGRGWVVCPSTVDGQSSSALPLIFFKVAVLAIGAMSEICSDQYLWVCLIKRRTNIQVLTKGLGLTNGGLQLVYTGIWCENSGSVLRWCPERSSDPCPRLVPQ